MAKGATDFKLPDILSALHSEFFAFAHFQQGISRQIFHFPNDGFSYPLPRDTKFILWHPPRRAEQRSDDTQQAASSHIREDVGAKHAPEGARLVQGRRYESGQDPLVAGTRSALAMHPEGSSFPPVI